MAKEKKTKDEKSLPVSEREIFAYMLTLQENRKTNGPLPEWETMKDLLEEFICCSKYSIQKELTDKGMLHWQAFFVTENRISPKSLLRKIRDNKSSPVRDFYGNGCCQLSPSRSQKDCDIYCQKDQTRVEGPYLYPKDRYSGQDLPLRNSFYPWQAHCVELVEGPINPRDVHVYVNYKGNCGKSDLVKWCSLNLGSVSVPLSRSAERTKSAMIDAGYRRCYMFDLTRNTTKDIGEIFDVIEELKTGHLKTGFYGKFKEVLQHRPHIVLFMNRMPRIDYLSRDMWKIHEITDPAQPCKDINVAEIRAIQAKQDTLKELERTKREYAFS